MDSQIQIEVVLINGKSRGFLCDSFSTEGGELEICKPGDKTYTVAPGQWISVEEL